MALTLRLLGGLGTDQVARAFLVSEATMAQRLVRAKRKIKVAHIPYRVPAEHELAERLRPVLTVVYLIYNAGADGPGGGRGVADDLRGEGIRLARMLAALMPDEPEVVGLLALLLLTESRRPLPVHRRRLAHPAARPGPHPVGPNDDRRRASDRARHACAVASSARISFKQRSTPSTPRWLGRGDRLGPSRRALRPAAVRRAHTGDQAEPGRGGGRGRRTGRRAGATGRARPGRTTTPFTPPAPTCCAGCTGRTRLPTRTAGPPPSRRPPPNGTSSPRRPADCRPPDRCGVSALHCLPCLKRETSGRY